MLTVPWLGVVRFPVNMLTVVGTLLGISLGSQTNMLTVEASSFGHLPCKRLLYSCIYGSHMGELWMLTYDVKGRDRGTAVRVCQLIFGRKNSTTKEGWPWTYEQPGFIHRSGVVWVGQSVLILPRADALE